MPLYEYDCSHCGPFVELIALRNYTASYPCPECGNIAGRVISTPNLAKTPHATRIAHERNERAAHEPQRVRKMAPSKETHQCTPKCQHQKSGQRPWMLGH